MPYSGYTWRTQNSEYSQEYSEYARGYSGYSHCAIVVLTQDAHMPYSGYTWRTQNSEYSQEYSEYAWGTLSTHTARSQYSHRMLTCRTPGTHGALRTLSTHRSTQSMHGGTLPRVEYDSHVGAEEAARCLTSLSTQNSEYSQEYSLRYCEYSHLVGYCEYSHLVRYCEYSHLLSLPASQAIRARTDVQPCALPPTTLAEDHPSGSTHSTPCEYPE
jgi:hypothetical protein